jgi:hypothetical protein
MKKPPFFEKIGLKKQKISGISVINKKNFKNLYPVI